MVQNRMNLSPNECNRLFRDYELFEYISQCYEEYHMQGDEANYTDLMKYLQHKRESTDDSE